MKIAVFTLPKGAKNPNINLNDKYQFVNGEFKCIEQDAEFVEKILVGYNGCTLSWEDRGTDAAQASGEGGDLSAASTKQGVNTGNGDNTVEDAGKTTTATTENGDNTGAGKTTPATTAEAAKPAATAEVKK